MKGEKDRERGRRARHRYLFEGPRVPSYASDYVNLLLLMVLIGCHTYAYEVQQRSIFHVLHDDHLWAAETTDDAMQVNNIDVIKLPHHRRLRHEVQPLGFRRCIAQRFYGNRSRRLTNRRQATMANVTELIYNYNDNASKCLQS